MSDTWQFHFIGRKVKIVETKDRCAIWLLLCQASGSHSIYSLPLWHPFSYQMNANFIPGKNGTNVIEFGMWYSWLIKALWFRRNNILFCYRMPWKNFGGWLTLTDNFLLWSQISGRRWAGRTRIHQQILGAVPQWWCFLKNYHALCWHDLSRMICILNYPMLAGQVGSCPWRI